MALLLSLLLVAGPGPCELLQPLATADPAAAALYREVAEAESAAGSREAALAAWRQVLRHEPEDERARAALRELCQEPQALAPPQSEVAARALLVGLAHFERGEEAAAQASLHQALVAPELADTASFLLGLIALRQGRSAQASTFLEAAAASAEPALAQQARELLTQARRSGWASLLLRLGSEYDSNVALIPGSSWSPAGSGDGAGLGMAELRLQPWGPRGLFARLTGHVRRLLRQSEFNLAGVGGALGWTQGGGQWPLLSAEYGVELLMLGEAPYLSTHRLQASARAPLGGHLALEVSWASRLERFHQPLFSGYSGWRHGASLQAHWSPSASLTLSAGYLGAALAAQEPALGLLEHGPQAGLRLQLSAWLRLSGALASTRRSYLAFDEALGSLREDEGLEAAAAVELDMAAHWSLQAQVSWRSVSSNVPQLAHQRLAAGLGLVWAAALQ